VSARLLRRSRILSVSARKWPSSLGVGSSDLWQWTDLTEVRKSSSPGLRDLVDCDPPRARDSVLRAVRRTVQLQTGDIRALQSDSSDKLANNGEALLVCGASRTS